MGGERLEAGESLSAVASAVTEETTAVEEEGRVDAGCLVDEEERFLDVFDAGRRRQDWESCPTCLHQGQALSEPGHDAMTLNPDTAKNRVAERDVPGKGV